MPRKTTSPGRTRGGTTVPCPGLRSAIERAGLSITDAAALADWERARVANWLSAGEAPKVSLAVLCRALDEHQGLEPGTTLERATTAPPEVDHLAEALAKVEAAEALLADARAELEQAKAERARNGR